MVEDTLRATRIYYVSRIGMIRGFYSLLFALMERWKPETHTFVLPVDEVTVTLEDVAHIFGLPIDGQVVSGWTDSSDKSMAYAHAKYLPLLRDFDQIHTYNWGQHVLRIFTGHCVVHHYMILRRWMTLLFFCLFGHGSECCVLRLYRDSTSSN
ncbi:hypothetical protein Ahy_A07g034019 [Arachis hypogaea]|uniref:Aminotransferase-like plant mobile domain-containing protein n=1 Tax=Arachis hypogaea TaxID=3818 RepID=A0A445CAP2_ARAHY|nr:hypothetical protein Ahy_A07g034019 [Arachis hypogaea]